MSNLASYAASEDNSRGRIYDESAPQYRDQFQRDRDRIIHSAAFRRLEYKTQVFVNHEGDMFRTRLTHSLEVSQLGRTVARALSLNEDLTEAICLAHDLGHTPFGHAGQDALNKCMREFGGFEHNYQSLRVVDELEERYIDFRGLNLMFETREGILKHCSRKNAARLGELGKRFIDGTQPSLEAQIANIADEIAYNNHDIDDGLRSGLINLEQLNSCSMFKKYHDQASSKWPGVKNKRIVNELIRQMINSLISDLIDTSSDLIKSRDLKNIDDVRSADKPLIKLSDNMREYHNELKRFLRKHLYSHYQVNRMSHKARVIITGLFETFMKNQSLLPHKIQENINHDIDDNDIKKIARTIADYIAGMTDRYAIAEYNRITDPMVNSY